MACNSTNVQTNELEQCKEYNIEIYCDETPPRLYKNAVNKFIIKYSGCYTITNINARSSKHSIYELKNADNLTINLCMTFAIPYYDDYIIEGIISRRDGKRTYEVIIDDDNYGHTISFENHNKCEFIKFIDLYCKITEVTMHVLK